MINLEKIKLLNNNVLLKVKKYNDKVELKGGTILAIDTSFEPEKHANIVCEVVATPERLVFGYSTERNQRGNLIPKPNSMDWKTTMELRKGDEVIIHFNAYKSAFEEAGKVVEVDGEEHFFCGYDRIFLAKRKWKDVEIELFKELNHGKDISVDAMEMLGVTVDKDMNVWNIIMLNGYMLVEPIEKEVTSKFLEIPKSIGNTDKKKVKVCYNGSDNEGYLIDVYEEARGLKWHDEIIIDKHCDIPLEYHETLNNKRYWRVQKNLVQGVVVKESMF
jgi:hypothetical protein